MQVGSMHLGSTGAGHADRQQARCTHLATTKARRASLVLCTDPDENEYPDVRGSSVDAKTRVRDPVIRASMGPVDGF